MRGKQSDGRFDRQLVSALELLVREAARSPAGVAHVGAVAEPP